MIQRTNKQGAAMLRRLAKAAWMVRTDGLLQLDENWVVKSDTGHMHVVNGACDCEDYTHNQKNHEGWCKHRLAVYLAQQVETSDKPLEEWLRIATKSVIEKHPADATNISGASDKYFNNCEGSATAAIFQARVERLESEVYALRAVLEEHLTRYEKHVEVRRAFAPR